MNFTEDMRIFSERVKQLKGQISTEEATKMSLIAPFFQLLGYDIFNPSEFCPEYTADVGIKKGEKVDYAILISNQPVILIEAKSVTKKLEKQDSQLFRYFTTTNARFAILTNGIIYKFYTDLAEKNKMDREPFYEFNMINFSDDDIKEISKFSKENFDEETVFNGASVLKYANLFRLEIQKMFAAPSDDLVRLFLKDYYKGTKTQNVIDRFRPVLKKALNDYLDETTKEKMTSIINDSGYITSGPTPDKAVPSDIELDALMAIKTILNDIVNMDDIEYKKTESYFAILYKGNTRKWLARLIIGDSFFTLIIPDKNKTELRFKIGNISEIITYTDLIKAALNNYLLPKDPTSYIYTKWGKYVKPDPYKVNIARNYPST